MDSIKIKPHHFMDIIKLYGAGIEEFVPDEKMGHDFYRVANLIVNSSNIELNLTIEADDICKPCKMCNDNICIDKLEHIEKFDSKDAYNKTLDIRLINILKLDIDKIYSAKELCEIMLENHHHIFNVWIEESSMITQKRHDMFLAGAYKYLK